MVNTVSLVNIHHLIKFFFVFVMRTFKVDSLSNNIFQKYMLLPFGTYLYEYTCTMLFDEENFPQCFDCVFGK